MNSKRYCVNAGCPFKECEHHLVNLKNTGCKRRSVKVANMDGVCRKYIGWLVDKTSELHRAVKFQEGISNIMNNKTKTERELDSEIWIVKWKTYKFNSAGLDPKYSVEHPVIKECFKAFNCEQRARMFARELEDAMAVLQTTALPDPEVYKQ